VTEVTVSSGRQLRRGTIETCAALQGGRTKTTCRAGSFAEVRLKQSLDHSSIGTSTEMAGQRGLAGVFERKMLKIKGQTICENPAVGRFVPK
jgi:hypothetical protein